ncbi:MAG: hypothetical protein HUU21_34240, partial [Polyangiaceae bacterium]|nr:hypothetical protein [Polyangiaceae bacterium]
MNRFGLSAWAFLALACATAGCELVAAVDREQIPNEGSTSTSGTGGGQGGQGGGAGG